MQNLTFDQIKQLLPNIEAQLLEAQNNLSSDTIFYKDPSGGNYFIKAADDTYYNVRYGGDVISTTTDGTHLMPVPYNPTTKQEFIDFILSYPPAVVYPSNKLFGIGDGGSMFGDYTSSYSFKEGTDPVMQVLAATLCPPASDTSNWELWNSAKEFWCETPSYSFKDDNDKEKLERLNFDKLLICLSSESSTYGYFTITFYNDNSVSLNVKYDPLLDLIYNDDNELIKDNIKNVKAFGNNLLEACETSDDGQYGKFYMVKHPTFGTQLFFASVDSWHDSNDPAKANVYLKYVGEIN